MPTSTHGRIAGHPYDSAGRLRMVVPLTARSIERRDDGGPIGFKGEAIMFNKRTWIGGKSWGFWEQIAPEAVTKTLAEADVRFLINHDVSLLLARNTAGTLRLTADTTSLRVDADMAPTSYTSDLAVLLERGDISQMSFAFEELAYTHEYVEDDKDLYTITELRLWDVSVVTFPAYEETTAGLRESRLASAMRRSAGLVDDDIENITRRLDDGDASDFVAALRAAARPPAETTGDPHAPAETTRDSQTDDPPVESTGVTIPYTRDMDHRLAELAQTDPSLSL